MVVYRITNLINGKIYVGKDKCNRPRYFGSGKVIRLAIKKYGKENFQRDILEVCTSVEHLRERECWWIQHLNARDPNVGYNLTEGGDGGDTSTFRLYKKASEATLQKMREARQGFSWGKHSQETKDFISRLHKGRVFSDAHKEHLSEARKCREISDETRKKMSESSKGRVNIKTYRVSDPEGNEFITQRGLTDFCRQHDLKVSLLILTRPEHRTRAHIRGGKYWRN